MPTLDETEAAYDRHRLGAAAPSPAVADVIIRLEAERDGARAERDEAYHALKATPPITWQEKDLATIDRLRAERDAARAELRELTQLVGAETPIGAATLAQTRYAMQSALMGEIAELRAERVELRHASTNAVMYARELRGLARDLVASLHGDGNGRCWCGAREADRLRGFLERAGREGVG